MSTRQEANRANAQHSTGPRTPGGKAKSSQNAFKPGLYSTQIVIPSTPHVRRRTRLSQSISRPDKLQTARGFVPQISLPQPEAEPGIGFVSSFPPATSTSEPKFVSQNDPVSLRTAA